MRAIIRLDDEELMEFIILPLSYRKKEQKEEKIRQTVGLAVQIKDREQQLFTLSGILAFTDKLIGKETANQIRRAIEMTQVAQIFEEEKQQAIQALKREKQRAIQALEKEKQQVLTRSEEEKRQAVKEAEQRTAKSNSRQIASLMIKKGYSTEEIISLVPNYSLNEVEALKAEILNIEKKNN